MKAQFPKDEMSRGTGKSPELAGAAEGLCASLSRLTSDARTTFLVTLRDATGVPCLGTGEAGRREGKTPFSRGS